MNRCPTGERGKERPSRRLAPFFRPSLFQIRPTFLLLAALLVSSVAGQEKPRQSVPAWATAHRDQAPPTAEQTQAMLREWARFVFDRHVKKNEESEQRGMVYEYFDVTRRGQFDQFVQGEALDTMHDGAWLAAALVNAYRATGDSFYKEFLTGWQLPFYLKMLNHSDELFTKAHNHARPDRQATWSGSKEWLFQPGEKGFVPYFWDDGGSISLEMRNSKHAGLAFPGFDQFALTGQPNPRFLLHGYSLGSSNHLAQDLGVMLQQAWLLLKDSADAADKQLAHDVALGARHLHECRMRHHGYIPMCTASAALCQADADLMKRVPAQDDWRGAAPSNHYVQALYSFKPGQRVALPGFADDQQYRYYYGLAKHAGVPRPLAFQLIYDAYTEPMLYRYYSDDAETPAGINRFDLHPYYCVDGKLTDYRSDRKGPSGKPRPIGSRMGPQNMVCCGWALQALQAYPGIWEEPYRTQFSEDARVYIVDPPVPSSGSEHGPSSVAPPAEIDLGGQRVTLHSTRHALKLAGRTSDDKLTFKVFSRPDGAGSHAIVSLSKGEPPSAVNDRGDRLQIAGKLELMDRGFRFEIALAYTVVKQQPPWANGIEHGRYSIHSGSSLRNFYLASDERQVTAWLRHELTGGLRTWQAIFREFGYVPTGIDAGANWQNFSDTGGYAHLLSAASQWLLCLAGKRDWEEQHVPAPRAGAEVK